MKVSVLVITYNHEKFIAQALDSILMQEVNLDFEILISEDCSTDDTREIIIGFQKRYPDRIRLLLSERNLNSNEVIVRGIRASQGQYIALLDGDDYWISPYKLQKQVDFLDSYPGYSLCFHNVNVVYENGNVKPHPFHIQEPSYRLSKPIPKPVSTLEDIAPGNFIQTCSVVFRAGLFSDFPDWYYSSPIGDWPLHILNAEHGNIGYLDEVLGVYRVHSGGLWSMNMSLSRKFDDVEKIINMYKTIDCHLNFRYNKEISKRVASLYYEVVRMLSSEHKYKQASYYAKKCLLSFPLQPRSRQKFLLKVMLKAYLPRVYDFLRMLRFVRKASKGVV